MLLSYKKNLLHRLKIAHGHLEKVIKMVEEEQYCLDVIQQSHAIQNALKKIDQILLENHLKTCVKSAILTDKNIDEKVKEIIEVFKRK